MVARFLDRIFQRLYGFTLGRSFRNSPDDACLDATTMWAILVGLLLTLTLMVVLAALHVDSLRSKDTLMWYILAAGVPVYLWSRKYRAYALMPESVAAYRTPHVRGQTFAMYLGVPLVSIVLAGAVLRLVR
jgi:uncharacterized membrane protein YhaH (DUF805 family)